MAKQIISIAAVSLILAASVSCSWRKDPDSQVTGQSDEEFSEQKKDPKGSKKALARLPHPKIATARHTRWLISLNPDVNREEIANCMEQVGSLASEATNPQAMTTARMQAVEWVKDNPSVHHWCFYHLMARLDDRLNKGGLLLEELATEFFHGMRALWILAQGLDATTADDIYFDYLRQRYVQISRDYFGRHLEVVGAPVFGKP